MVNLRQELVQKLAAYFQIRNKNAEQIADLAYQSLMNNVNFDVQKLSDILDALIVLKQNGQDISFQQADSTFDISNGDNGVMVKPITTPEKSVLYFYGKNGSLIYKLKHRQKNGQYVLSAESAVNEHSVTKEDLDKMDPEVIFYRSSDKVVYEGETYLHKRSSMAKTGYFEETFAKSDMCSEYANFYLFLKNVLNKNGQKALEHLSVVKSDFLFASFYEKLKQLCGTPNELSMAELTYIMAAVLGDGKYPLFSPFESDYTFKKTKFSDAVDFIGKDVALNKEKHEGSVEVGSDDERVTIKFCSSDKYISLHLVDANGGEIVNYILGQTDKGFTLFKALKADYNLAPGSVARMFTLNLTDDTFRLCANERLDSRKEGNSLESLMQFYPNGEVSIVNTSAVIYGKEVQNQKQTRGLS